MGRYEDYMIEHTEATERARIAREQAEAEDIAYRKMYKLDDPKGYVSFTTDTPKPVKGEGTAYSPIAFTEDEQKEMDNVKSPDHYKYEGGRQAIDILHDIFPSDHFVSCMIYNVLKYVLRFKRKNGVEDLRKAQVYLSWAIEKLESGKISHE